jgi:hypothetical protein
VTICTVFDVFGYLQYFDKKTKSFFKGCSGRKVRADLGSGYTSGTDSKAATG